MASSQVMRALTALGGKPQIRAGVVTDNGNCIIDVAGLQISEPEEFESRVDGIVGVVTNGIFAKRPADVLLLATAQGVQTLSRN